MNQSIEEESSLLNQTKSIDMETQVINNEEEDEADFKHQLLIAQQAESSINQKQDQQDVPQKQSTQNKEQLVQIQLPLQQEVMITIPQGAENREKVQNISDPPNHQENATDIATEQTQHLSAISDKKIWAIQGQMPGQISKGFVRSYKVGKYNKLKSLKEDMEFLNSPHHEPKHLGNQIFPFQNNLKNRIHTVGSFDYSKYIQLQEQKQFDRHKQGVKRSSEVFSPRTTTNAVMSQILKQQQQEKKQQQQQNQMEIRYIDIVSQPIIKSIDFYNNPKCAHGMVSLRHCPSSKRTNAYSFLPPSQVQKPTGGTFVRANPELQQQISSPLLHVNPSFEPLLASNTSYQTLSGFFQPKQDSQTPNYVLSPEDSFQNDNTNTYYSKHMGQQTSKTSLSLQPKNIILQKSAQATTSTSFFHKTNRYRNTKNQVRSSNNISTHQQLPSHLPAFASVLENMSYFSRAKKNLVNYVNEIGVQDNPLLNTFVQKPKLI